MRTIEVDGGRWWWRGPLVGPSSTGALSGHSALLFSVFLFSLPFHLAAAPRSFLSLSHRPSDRSLVPSFIVRFTPTAFPVLPASSADCQANFVSSSQPRANERESKTSNRDSGARLLDASHFLRIEKEIQRF